MSHPEHETPQDLAAAFALGALSPEETKEFEAFLKGSPEAQREVAEYREIGALLALTGSDAAPSPGLRDRVVSRMHGHIFPAAAPARASGPVARPGPAWGAMAAGLLAAVGLGFGYVQMREVTDLRKEIRRVLEQYNTMSGILAERDATIKQLVGPGVQLFQLTASGDPNPAISLFWDRVQHRAVVHGHKLKSVGQGQAYQLWFIKDGSPVPSVTFKPDPTGAVHVEQIPVPPDGELSAAAVTVEPEAGSAQPTSPILLVGKLKES